jgi:formamidopyrimidine-DNA glycosylase
MPELPDIVVDIESLEKRIGGQAPEGIRLLSPCVLRSVEPPNQEAVGRRLAGLRRLGERMASDLETFRARLRQERHTLKRALTTPRLNSGVGNVDSDEILHRARLLSFMRSDRLTDGESPRLFEAGRQALSLWVRRLREESGGRFPARVTAFRPEMAMHGRCPRPCPGYASPVQRLVYAVNEPNDFARCQAGGMLLSDRALARLLKDDSPCTVGEPERRMKGGRERA